MYSFPVSKKYSHDYNFETFGPIQEALKFSTSAGMKLIRSCVLYVHDSTYHKILHSE